MMNKCEKSTIIAYKFQAFNLSEGVWNEGHMVYYFAKKSQAVIHVNFSKYIDATLWKGPGVAQWLRHCATSRAVPVASVTGIFLVDTDRTICPEVNSASKKWVPGIPLGVKAAGAWGWRPTTLVVPNVKKSEALTYPDPLGPSRRPVVGETFTFTFTYFMKSLFLKQWNQLLSY